jgi:cellobiose phosphorylase
VPIGELADWLEATGRELLEHIRTQEWIRTGEGFSWFNGYYDNEGRRLEGDSENGVRMTLTGQVFTLLCGVADDKQAREVVRSVDHFLWDANVGGPRLNTNFHEVLLNMGRCFGFAYGHKENGSMFSHMAVMYAYALYRRGFVKEGHRILSGIFHQASNFDVSRIFPGIPEYFDQNGRGMYPYLTGSASWYLLTLLTEVLGIRGDYGDLLLEPKLVGEQFDEGGRVSVHTSFAERDLEIYYLNHENSDYPDYTIGSVSINGVPGDFKRRDNGVLIPLPILQALAIEHRHTIEVMLLHD